MNLSFLLASNHKRVNTQKERKGETRGKRERGAEFLTHLPPTCYEENEEKNEAEEEGVLNRNVAREKRKREKKKENALTRARERGKNISRRKSAGN